MSNLINFNFQSNDFRVVQDNGDFWFPASDVCAGLDIANHRDAVSALNRSLKEAGIEGVVSTDTLVQTAGGKQSILCVNETGLNLLVMQSRKKSALVFKFWLASEVLPSIRKTGTYTLTINAQQKNQIQQLVNAKVRKTGKAHQAIYTELRDFIGVNSYHEIPALQFEQAVEFLDGTWEYAPKPAIAPLPQPTEFKVPDGMMLVPRTAALNLWSMAKQLTSGIDALGMIDGDMPKWLTA